MLKIDDVAWFKWLREVTMKVINEQGRIYLSNIS